MQPIRKEHYDLYRDKDGELWWLESYDRFKLRKVGSPDKHYYDTWDEVVENCSGLEYAFCDNDIIMHGNELHVVKFTHPHGPVVINRCKYYTGYNSIITARKFKLVQRCS